MTYATVETQRKERAASGMDIPRPGHARKKRMRRVIYIVATFVLLALITVVVSRLKPAVPTVEKASLWTGTVKRGSMLREVRGNGTLVPEDIRWIVASSPGRIDRILVLPGAAVHVDTVLLELSNPELEQAAFDAESQLQAAEAQLEKLKVQLESDRLTQEAAVASLKADLAQAKLEAEAEEGLLKDGLVPELTAKRSRAKADELEARYRLEQKRLEIGAKSGKAQMIVQETELAKIRKQNELKKRQVEALKVKAGVEGVLQRIGDEKSLQVGQQLGAGANIARIANPTRLKAEIKIAETQARDIQLGQPAAIDTRNGVVSGHVTRIDPAVINGTVTVDIALDEAPPRGARPDLSVDGTVTLERLEDVLYVGRPVHGQTDSKISIFKLVDAGKNAVRIPVKLGRSSVNSIEIVEGLEIGDQVILSDMSQWDAHERVRVR